MIIEYTYVFINIDVGIMLAYLQTLVLYERSIQAGICLSRKYRSSRRWKRVKSDPVAARLLDPDVSIKVPARSVQSDDVSATRNINVREETPTFLESDRKISFVYYL